MKILVTGGAGYVGSVLVPLLLYDKHDVTVLDNFMYGQNSLAGCCSYEKFHLIKGDCRDSRVIEPLIKEADIVIPLAAIVGAAACAQDENAAHWTNTHAIRILRYHLATAQRLIFPMTNSGYGVGEDGECTEESPLRPVSFYGRSKVAAEEEVLRHENAVSFRFATIFGASFRMRTDLMVNDFVLRAVRDRVITLFEPGFRRNFLHVRDAANAFRSAIAADDIIGVYNVGDSRANMTKVQLAELIKDYIPDFHIGVAENAQDPDKRDYVVSNAKIEATGWFATRTVDDGITELMKLYQGLRTNSYGNA